MNYRKALEVESGFASHGVVDGRPKVRQPPCLDMKTSQLTACIALLVCSDVAPNLCAQSSDVKADARNSLADLVRLYRSDWMSVSQFYNLPWSATRSDRIEQLYKQWQERLANSDFESLGQQGRLDYLLLRNKLAVELARLSLERRWLSQMEELLPFREALQHFERERWRMRPVDAQASAAKIAALPDQIKKLRQRLEKGKEKPKNDKTSTTTDAAKETDSEKKKESIEPLKASPTLARRAASAVGDLRGTLKTWFAFYDGYQPDFSWWVRKPHDEAASALDDYAKFLREEIAGLKGKDEDPLIGDPIGAEALASDLAAEMIPYSAEEVIAIGEKEFAWCEARMREAAQEMGLEWKAALAKVKSQFVPPGQQDDFVAEMARDAIQFVKSRDLLTIPALCEETWRVTMISPEGQKTLPFAAYGGQNVMVAYAKEEMKHDDKLMAMRGNNRHFTRIVTAHELIPGHHLQLFMADRHQTHRTLFSTPFLVEGWPLYWEMKLWDLAYGQSAEDRIGMLFWRMHRSARIIVSLKFHLGQMTPAEMIDFLVDGVGHERFGATSEVRRFIGGSYSPLYQCSYMIGGLQLRALHKEIVGAGRMPEKQFNDTVLTYGAIPIEFIRAGMLNLPLTRETQASWRFAP